YWTSVACSSIGAFSPCGRGTGFGLIGFGACGNVMICACTGAISNAAPATIAAALNMIRTDFVTRRRHMDKQDDALATPAISRPPDTTTQQNQSSIRWRRAARLRPPAE